MFKNMMKSFMEFIACAMEAYNEPRAAELYDGWNESEELRALCYQRLVG